MNAEAHHRSTEQKPGLGPLFEWFPDGVVLVAGDGSIVDLNRRAEALFGYERAEVVGRHVQVLFPLDAGPFPGSGPPPSDPDNPIVNPVVEIEARREDGAPVSVEVSLGVFDAGDEHLVCLAVRDITDRGRAELLEHAPEATVIVDSAGVIRLANRRAEKLFGYRRNELAGRPAALLFDDESPLGLLLAGTPTQTQFVEAAGRRSDGTDFPAAVTMTPIVGEHGVAASLAIHDVREREEVEQEQRTRQARVSHARRLESLGELAGGVAHDFNNILAAILNYARFAAEGLGRDSPVQSDLEGIRRAAERAAAMTRQLLIFSRRERSKPQVLDVNTLVLELQGFLHTAIGEQVALSFTPSADSWHVKADPAAIEQVLVNLVLNARDAIRSGGTIRVTIANVVIGNEMQFLRMAPNKPIAPGRYVRLTVGDTGAGMSEEVLARALEPYFTTKSDQGGTGLGLSTVRANVREAGGGIEIYSQPGKGTTVRVYLPATSEAETPPETEGPVPPPARTGTVLLVEDDKEVRGLVERVLSGAGYRVIPAADGAEALALWHQESVRVDVLVSDVVMPQMSGPELVRRMRLEQPDLKVLFMSGYPPGPEDAGTIAVLEKPFTREGLLEAVGSLFDGYGRIRVLVVDDHRMFADALAASLHAQPDIDVAGIVHTGTDALKTARTVRPDVVLLDFGLPDLDGSEVARRLRAVLPDIRVVMVSNTSSEAIITAAIDAGCSGYIGKDRPLGELADAVRKVHASEPAYSAAMLGRMLPKLRRDHRPVGWDLTPREREFLALLALGSSTDDIASAMMVSPHTVRKHVQNIITKLGAHSKLEAVAIASREGLLDRA